MGIEHPLLTERVTHPKNRAAEHLPAECARMDHRAHVRVGQVIHDQVLAGLDVDLDLGEASNVGVGRAVARVSILGCCHEALAREGSH